MSERTPDLPAGISLENWLSPPYAHWSFQHVDDFVPTAVISRGCEPVAELPLAGTALAEIPVTPTSGPATTVGSVMAATASDGWAVAHRGSIVAEEYFGGMGIDSRHLVFSVSKSLLAAVVGALHGDGVIELDAPVTAYVPALADCGYAGATVRNLLDMRSGIAFSDDYLDPGAEIHVLEQAVGWQPRTSASVPSTLYDYLLTLQRKSAHGGPFAYRSCDTDVLGWICEVVAGQRIPELMSQLLWSRIGARRDATIGVDAAGTGFFDGGVSTCLTDMIRFGSLFLRDGVSLTDQQVAAGGLGRGHPRWRARLAPGVRRLSRQHRPARRHVPQSDVDSLPRQRRCLVPGHVRPNDLCQPRHRGRRREGFHASTLARAAHAGHAARIRCGGT